MTLGSKLFTKPQGYKTHLIQARPDGLGGELGKLRADVVGELAPLKAKAIEEWDDPQAAQVDAIVLSIATATSAVVFKGAGLNGVIGAAALNGSRLISVTQSTAGAHYAGSVIVKGLDAQGKNITDTIALTASPGGPVTTDTTKYFAKVIEIDVPAQVDLLGNFSIGIDGNNIGLSRPPKIRTGAYFIDKEFVDGGVVTSGALIAAGSAPPYGAYTPASPPTSLGPAQVIGITDITVATLYGSATHAVLTGTADITAGALYGGGGTFDGKTLTLNINEAGATSLVLNGATNTANEAAFLAAILAQWPTLASAVAGGPGGNKLVLTTTATKTTASIAVTLTTGSTTAGIAGTVTGSGDLDADTIIATINGVLHTLTLSGVGNSANEAALLAAIIAQWPTLTAVQGGPGGNKLVLTDTVSGPTSSISIGAGTADAALGITGLSSTGGGHQYAVTYEYDPSV